MTNRPSLITIAAVAAVTFDVLTIVSGGYALFGGGVGLLRPSS